MKPVPRLVCLVSAILIAGSGLASAAPTSPVPVQFAPDIELSADKPATLYHIEPTIAADPRDPNHLVAGFFGPPDQATVPKCFAEVTFDAGATWIPAGTAPLASEFDDCADPSMAADLSGTFYYAYGTFRGTPQGYFTTLDIRVARSTDGGRSFPESSTAVAGGTGFGTNFPDKPWMAVDAQPKSRFKGTIYVSYTDFDSPDGINVYTIIFVTVSRDGGRTWSTPVAVSRFAPYGAQLVQGSETVVAPDGTAYLFYMDSDALAVLSSIKFVKSKDGGRSWSAPANVAANLPSPGLFNLDNGDPQFGTGGAAFGIFGSSIPTAAIAPDGSIYVAWTDFPQGRCVPRPGDPFNSDCFNADVRLSVSKDGGSSWNAPRKVSDDQTQADQFFPWIAPGPDGLLSLIWQDRRLDPKLLDYDIFYSNTSNGRTFLPNVRVSSQTSNVNSSFYEGDYNALAVTSAGIFPVWNDGRFNSVQIFTARGTLAP